MFRLVKALVAAALLVGGVPPVGVATAHGDDTLESEAASQTLLRAAAAGDPVLTAFALGKVSPDVRDDEGRTPLMLAAASGDFSTVREILRVRADARTKDKSGKIARDYLEPGTSTYAPLNLILRAHEFTQEHARPDADPRVPHLTLISDSYIDYTHPILARNYQKNVAEEEGDEGVDDDDNGFVDDVYGWNLANDSALEPPILAVAKDETTRKFLEDLAAKMDVVRFGDPEERAEIEAELEESYQNPLVRQMGMATMRAGELDLSDLKYGKMLFKGSHGTHVAGIVSEASGYKAMLHGMTWGEMTEAEPDGPARIDLKPAAEASDSFSDFVLRVWKELCEEQLLAGQRASDYVRAVGAGVVNMSWSKNLGYYRGFAKRMKEAYRKYGKRPETIDTRLPKGLDLAEDLGLEILVADAAFFAILFAENPNVLFVIAAGNEAENNDEILPSPGYLSRLFPNAITVASHDGKGGLSDFSNYGVNSVQIAAEGEEITSTVNAGVLGKMSGTSMAAPAVSGVAARIRAENPDIHASEIPTILQAAVIPSDDLRGKVAAGGYLDTSKALTIASSWNKDLGFGLRSAELRRSAPDAAPIFRKRPTRTGSEEPSPAEEVDGKYRVDILTGFPNSWRMILTKIPEGIGCRIRKGAWKKDWIVEGWEKGYSISALGGERDNWAVCMDDLPRGDQRMIGYDFDHDEILESFEEGYRITQLAGYGKSWALVMEKDTGWGSQQYSLPTPVDDDRLEWIEDLWDEGYDITSVAGENIPGDESDGYVFIMTKGTGWGKQAIRWDQPWPADWIAEKTADGYRITTATGYDDRWVVVMTKDAGDGKQITFQSSDGLPMEELKKRW